MASRLISAILWTLVGINLIALVLGGLSTWLSYAIPARLRHIGLSPELTQMAGFAALLMATLGLSALNYSSHCALNAYGLSCATFIIFMLIGFMPDAWQQSITQQQQSAQRASNGQQVRNSANHSSSIALIMAKPLAVSQPPIRAHKLLSTGPAPSNAGLLVDFIYFALLLLLTLLLVFSCLLAQHFRRREREELAREEQHQQPAHHYSYLLQQQQQQQQPQQQQDQQLVVQAHSSSSLQQACGTGAAGSDTLQLLCMNPSADLSAAAAAAAAAKRHREAEQVRHLDLSSATLMRRRRLPANFSHSKATRRDQSTSGLARSTFHAPFRLDPTMASQERGCDRIVEVAPFRESARDQLHTPGTLGELCQRQQRPMVAGTASMVPSRSSASLMDELCQLYRRAGDVNERATEWHDERTEELQVDLASATKRHQSVNMTPLVSRGFYSLAPYGDDEQYAAGHEGTSTTGEVLCADDESSRERLPDEFNEQRLRCRCDFREENQRRPARAPEDPLLLRATTLESQSDARPALAGQQKTIFSHASNTLPTPASQSSKKLSLSKVCATEAMPNPHATQAQSRLEKSMSVHRRSMCKSQTRAQGHTGSSVMAMTAAAATALFGGVVDGSLLDDSSGHFASGNPDLDDVQLADTLNDPAADTNPFGLESAVQREVGGVHSDAEMLIASGLVCHNGTHLSSVPLLRLARPTADFAPLLVDVRRKL